MIPKKPNESKKDWTNEKDKMFLKKDGSNYSTTNTFMQYNAKCDDAQIKLFVYFTLFQGSWVSKGLQYLTFLGIGARLLPVNGRDSPRIILQKPKPKPSHSSCLDCYVLFNVPLEKFSFIWRYHGWQCSAAKCLPLTFV